MLTGRNRDQELRFTVHESPDYHNLKVSIFNDDKKTDLIGEAYISLQDVCIPGGGKHDGWHALNFKGKYAGEINLELTYYDSRPPVENKRRVSGMSSADGGQRKTAPIKRRPLPAELVGGPPPGSIVPDHARGPRQMAGRAQEDWTPNGLRPRPVHHAHTAPAAPPVQYYDPDELDLDYHPGYQPAPMPELPQIPPARKHRGSMPPQPTMQLHDYPGHEHYNHSRSQSNPHLSHTYSAPNVGLSDRAWEETLPRCLQPTVEDIDEFEADREMPPLPPSHTRSAPPVQRGPPPRSMSVDDYAPPPPAGSYYGSSPNFRSSFSGYPPPAPSSVAASSHYGRHSRAASRHSVADPYAMTPPRAHPLANEMRRSMSPSPYGEDLMQYQHSSNEPSPLARPPSRNVSPLPPRNNLDAIRHPVRTFASTGSSPTRRDVPRPSTSNSSFFSPDSFDAINPNANSPFATTSNPHSPYHIQNEPSANTDDEGSRPLPDPNAKIVGFDGRVIDPSDHLPVHSWAPEPEKKTPTKVYGSNGQSHPHGLAGPRSAVSTPTRMSMGRDVVVNVRTRNSPPKRPMSSASHHSHMTGSNPPGPLSEIDIPNPYAGNSVYSANFADGRPGVYEGQQSQYRNPSPSASPHYGDVFGKYTAGPPPDQHAGGYENQGQSAFEQHGYGVSALSKEMAKIDIGGSRRPLSRGTVRRGAWP